MEPSTGWSVVVPMKDTRRAKSRMPGSPGERRELAIVMARDTLSAIVETESVHEVVVVCEREEDRESFQVPGVRVAVRSGLDLNESIRAGVSLVRAEDPDRDVAALPGDLPYLRAGELEAALSHAAQQPRAVVADRTGAGTTLLTARGGHELDPRYGWGSLGRHRDTGAVPLSVPMWSGVRRDVDEEGDLVPGPALGRRTRALLARRTGSTTRKAVSA